MKRWGSPLQPRHAERGCDTAPGENDGKATQREESQTQKAETSAELQVCNLATDTQPLHPDKINKIYED